MDKLSDLSIKEYDYADLIKEYELKDFYPCVNKFKIVRFKINNTDQLFVNTLRRVLISMIPAKRFECNNVPRINNGLINYIIPDEIKFRIGLLQIPDYINSDLVFEIKYTNNTFEPVAIGTKHIKCTNDPKFNITEHMNYVHNIFTLQPGGTANIENIRISEGSVQSNARFTVVSSCGINFDNLKNTEIEANAPDTGRTYSMVVRYIEKYDIKKLFNYVSEIVINKLNSIEDNTVEYDDRIEITFSELYTISNILYENLIKLGVTVKQELNDENKILILKIYDINEYNIKAHNIRDKKIINDIINTFITRMKSFITQF